MNELLIIGDTHGKTRQYHDIIRHHTGRSVQVGDFGFKREHEWFLKSVDFTRHKINFGNHDDYSFFLQPHSLGNWSESDGVMTIRGADSIDKAYRVEGVSWWRNEEMGYEEMLRCIDVYKFNEPRVVISHDCPQSIRHSFWGISGKSLTSNGLQMMLEAHQPEIWIFGHHHSHKDNVVNGTRFICLDELETFYLD